MANMGICPKCGTKNALHDSGVGALQVCRKCGASIRAPMVAEPRADARRLSRTELSSPTEQLAQQPLIQEVGGANDFIRMSCPSCGGKLTINSDIERFTCMYCSGEYLVRRGGGVISLAPVIAGIKAVGRGVDKTAAELAIQRLQKESDEVARRRRKTDAELGSLYFNVVLLVSLGATLLLAVLLIGIVSHMNVGYFPVMFVMLLGVAYSVQRFKLVRKRARALSLFTTQLDDQRVAIEHEIAQHKATVRL